MTIKTGALTAKMIWQALNDIMDPEIPVVSLVEMGIVRDVEMAGDTVIVTVTPTFSGCPALHVMKASIEERLLDLGATSVKVTEALAPPWSSDWITVEARGKLKKFGLAPPPVYGGDLIILFSDTAACPYCDSEYTTLKNSFGPTPCRMIYYCNDCQQPFEQFKPL